VSYARFFELESLFYNISRVNGYSKSMIGIITDCACKKVKEKKSMLVISLEILVLEYLPVL
jgi:hypothetical protein